MGSVIHDLNEKQSNHSIAFTQKGPFVYYLFVLGLSQTNSVSFIGEPVEDRVHSMCFYIPLSPTDLSW